MRNSKGLTALFSSNYAVKLFVTQKGLKNIG